jgi:hypothetical protein
MLTFTPHVGDPSVEAAAAVPAEQLQPFGMAPGNPQLGGAVATTHGAAAAASGADAVVSQIAAAGQQDAAVAVEPCNSFQQAALTADVDMQAVPSLPSRSALAARCAVGRATCGAASSASSGDGPTTGQRRAHQSGIWEQCNGTLCVVPSCIMAHQRTCLLQERLKSAARSGPRGSAVRPQSVWAPSRRIDSLLRAYCVMI